MLIVYQHICMTKYIFRSTPTSWRSSIVFGLSIHLSVHLSVRPSVRLLRWCGHSNLVIFNQISSKHHIWIASMNSDSNSNIDFFRQMIIKMVGKMAAVFQFTSIVVTFTLLHLIDSSKFHILFASIKVIQDRCQKITERF